MAQNNWQLETDDDGIVWASLCVPDEKLNVLNAAVVDEFRLLVDAWEKNLPKGVVLSSHKPRCFIAGADIKQFQHVENAQAAEDWLLDIHQLFSRFEALSCPTVALIDGFCLGGGTELALSCGYRVAIDTPQTKIGLPEVRLGICPGWGGTVRLPRLIGIQRALPLLLTGRLLSARQAKRQKLVDAAVMQADAKSAVRYFILKKPKRAPLGWMDRVLAQRFFRAYVANKARASLRQRGVSREHYPSPWLMIDNWQQYGAQGQAAMRAEVKAVAQLVLTDTSKHLVQIFFLQERLKALGKQSTFKIRHVHVIGAGTMGGDIAAWCALKGYQVTLQDQDMARIAPAIKRASRLYQKRLKIPRLVQAVMDRLQPDVRGDGLHHADCVIEAIFESASAKQDLFRQVEEKAPAHAILATNTSSIPLDEINGVLKRPERLVGIHYFNPVAKMPLVEVVSGEKTDEQVAQAAMAFVVSLGKYPLPVRSTPGFLVNRVLLPYLTEAVSLLDEGMSASAIDKIALNFGMPMGPVRLADTVGLDICLSVANNLSHHYGGSVPARLKKQVDAGHLGVKTGRGFYRYDPAGKVLKSSDRSDHRIDPDALDRLILRFLNEAVACLREGVVANEDLINAGMIFGTGFAPFRGGPMAYAKTRGVSVIVDRLDVLREKYGERFTPDAGWSQLGETDEIPQSKSGVADVD